MHRHYIILILALLVCGACANRPVSSGHVAAAGLRTDLMEMTDPAESGDIALIASSKPQFSWVVPSVGDNTRQVAYKIGVYEWEDYAAQKMKGRSVPVWDSGWVESDTSVAVPYQGPELKPDTEYCWTVELKLSSMSKRLKTSESVYKRFKTDKTLAEYATPSYPLLTKEETCETPVNGIYDFKKAAFGKLVLTLNAAKDDNVTVIIGERLKDGVIEHTPRVSSVVYDEIDLRVKEGTHTYLVEPNCDARNTGPMAVPLPEYAGVVAPFRFCSISGDVEPVSVKRISYHYPFDANAASFRCSNDTLNAIWDLCHYSLEPCSFLGIWVDGNRERIPYEYDALIAQLCHYGGDAEYSIDRRTLEWLLEKPTWPTEWILYTVEIAWNDYLWTGDSRALKANYDILKAHSLDALRKANGLISTKQGQTPEFLASINRTGAITDIVDWPHNKIEDDGFVYTDFNAVVNALYYRTLLRLGDIASVLAKENATGYAQLTGNYAADAAGFKTEAVETRNAFRNAFYDAASGLVRDGINTDHASLHSNMMAILCGLLEEDEIPAAADFVESRGLMCSIFGAHNFLESLYAAGRGSAALRFMTNDSLRGWFNGLRLGTTITLEAWDDSFKPNQDWNHIAGAAPGNAIPFGLMGVRPVEPGFSHVEIRPQIGNLEWAEMTLPTIRGSISVSIRDGEMKVTIPANMTADIWLPNKNNKMTRVTVGSGSYTYKY
ncbi:MAG: alpha-L-rhamnosidase [Bacteroidales bacterium]|nr:alpha-L-rhamnosidase [Bacteroidales bacterium]